MHQTDTFHILHNFPQEIIDDLSAVYYNKEYTGVKEVVKNSFWHYVLEDYNHPVYKHFPAPEEWASIEYYLVSPGFKNSPHLDRGRWCAINIAMEADYDNSFFFTGKHLWLGHYEWNEERNNNENRTSYLHDAMELGPKGFYNLTPEQTAKYNLKKPVFFNTKVPHGGDNVNASTPRLVISIGCNKFTYEQMLNRLPLEWFGDQ